MSRRIARESFPDPCFTPLKDRRLKADLERAVGLEPVKASGPSWLRQDYWPEPQEFIVQRLRDAAGRHVLKEGWSCFVTC